MRGWLFTALFILPASIAMAQAPAPVPETSTTCDALCQVNKALKESAPDQPTVGSRAGNTGTIQQKKTGMVPGAIVSPTDATK